MLPLISTVFYRDRVYDSRHTIFIVIINIIGIAIIRNMIIINYQYYQVSKGEPFVRK